MKRLARASLLVLILVMVASSAEAGSVTVTFTEPGWINGDAALQTVFPDLNISSAYRIGYDPGLQRCYGFFHLLRESFAA